LAAILRLGQGARINQEVQGDFHPNWKWAIVPVGDSFLCDQKARPCER